MALDLSQLPIPALSARWMAIYLEPMMGSGERLTIAIAATSRTENRVVRTVRNDVADALYGPQARNFLGLCQMIIDSVSTQLKSGIDLSNLSPPISGAYFGHVHQALGNDMSDVLRQGITLSASLSSMELIDEESEETKVNDAESRRWLSLIRDLVELQRPATEAMFNKKIKLQYEGAAIRIGFIGYGLAVNFSTFRPQYIAASLREGRAKLWELALIKQSDLEVKAGELMVFVPSETDPTYSLKQHNAARMGFGELLYEADKQNLRVSEFNNPGDAASLLLQNIA